MKTTLALCAATAAAALAAACTPAANTAATAPADTAAVTREITDIETRWSAMAAAKDITGFAAMYDDDAYVYLSGAPPMHGPAEVLAGLTPVSQDPNFAVSFQTARVRVSAAGDFACSEGTYSQTGTNPASHQAATERGHYVTCWRRNAAGQWRAIVDISTADPSASTAPAAPAAPASAPAANAAP